MGVGGRERPLGLGWWGEGAPEPFQVQESSPSPVCARCPQAISPCVLQGGAERGAQGWRSGQGAAGQLNVSQVPA